VNDLQVQAQQDIDQRRKATARALKLQRRFRPEGHRRQGKQALTRELGEGYENLPTLFGWVKTEQGFEWHSVDYAKLYSVAKRFAVKAKLQDQEDLLHDIIIGLAEITKRKLIRGEEFSELAMLRTAEHIKDHYWYKRYSYYMGLYCRHCSKEQRAKCRWNWGHTDWAYADCHRAIQLESLNKEVTDSEGNITELGELIADDNSLDLEAWTDAKLWLLKAPMRLKSIAIKKANDQALTPADRVYIHRLRKARQENLFPM
jgi:hypothetical protein